VKRTALGLSCPPLATMCSTPNPLAAREGQPRTASEHVGALVTRPAALGPPLSRKRQPRQPTGSFGPLQRGIIVPRNPPPPVFTPVPQAVQAHAVADSHRATA
jgi:hypothetical protein